MKKLFPLIFISLPAISDVVTLECVYTKWSDVSGIHKTNAFEFKFVSDTATGKTYMNGNNGSSEVVTLAREDGGMNFLEISSTGNVMLTTVLPGGSSVHSRNTAIDAEFVASQYYGSCEVK